MLEYQEDVTTLALMIHENLVTQGLIEDSDETFESIVNTITEFAGFPEYRYHN